MFVYDGRKKELDVVENEYYDLYIYYKEKIMQTCEV